MKVLIIENEFYLAQSISIKLSEIGYNCDIISSINELNNDKDYEIILLSTNTDNFLKTIEKFNKSIIILLISYISTDTVSTPLNLGANDYIQKPFMVEELTRKINHYKKFKKLQMINENYQNYINFKANIFNINEINYKKIKLPLILKTNKQEIVDIFLLKYMENHNIKVNFINLLENNHTDKINKSKNEILYLENFDLLKNLEKEKILNLIDKKEVILHTNSNIQTSIEIIDLYDGEKVFLGNEILTIDEYVKYIITNYQNIFHDTDLSKKLGISRKSLWERRKKYEISKKK